MVVDGGDRWREQLHPTYLGFIQKGGSDTSLGSVLRSNNVEHNYKSHLKQQGKCVLISCKYLSPSLLILFLNPLKVKAEEKEHVGACRIRCSG